MKQNKVNKKIFSIIFFSVFYFIFTLLSISSVLASACANPTLYSEAGFPHRSAIRADGSGLLTINGSLPKYESVPMDQFLDYHLMIENPIDQVVTLTIVAGNDIKDYVYGNSTTLTTKGEIKDLLIKVWTNDKNKIGTIYAIYSCEYFSNAIPITLKIYGRGPFPPPVTTCQSPEKFNRCWEGIYYSFYCSGNELLNNPTCTEKCCKQFGGSGAFCSPDKKTCLSMKSPLVGKEGNIAFVCNKKDCSDSFENKIMILLNFKGWNITGKYYKDWNESDLKKYDIIACADQSRSCKIDFNSPIYNAHTEDRIPILEITNQNSAKAANSFDYVSKPSGTRGKGPYTLISDVITQGIPTPFDPVNGNMVAGIYNKSITPSVIELLYSLYHSDRIINFFKVNETVDHGRYAFIGWLYDSELTDLSTGANLIINNTLKWLKCGDECFGGSNPDFGNKFGKLAFLCTSDRCSNIQEKTMIKWLRKNNFAVAAMGVKSWENNADLLSSFDAIVCTSTSTCRLKDTSPIITVHLTNGVGFLEISSSAYAGNKFGYTTSPTTRSSKTDTVKIIDGDPLITNGNATVLQKSQSIYGVKVENLNSVDDMARLETRYYNLSVMFKKDSSGSSGKYMFVGWTGKSVEQLNDLGEKLLVNAVKWMTCGDSCIETLKI